MTLKEIEKIIDEADVMLIKGENVFEEIVLTEDKKKKIKDLLIDYQKIQPYDSEKHYFYKFNEETGEMKLLAKVDHIDEEKKTKVIKKKIDEMSKDEIIQVQERFCEHKEYCHKCPFSYESTQGHRCLRDYWFWKEGVENNKDKEFEIEVEK